ncbi:2 TM domain-containing transmembrane protein [Acrasis kona]|uniref:2 TM domain-containing transmembrane protein n=1 Tax=Acrasis kona TaxID=1008807 RepID=A0AAW2YW93_9EUKA
MNRTHQQRINEREYYNRRERNYWQIFVCVLLVIAFLVFFGLWANRVVYYSDVWYGRSNYVSWYLWTWVILCVAVIFVCCYTTPQSYSSTEVRQPFLYHVDQESLRRDYDYTQVSGLDHDTPRTQRTTVQPQPQQHRPHYNQPQPQNQSQMVHNPLPHEQV